MRLLPKVILAIVLPVMAGAGTVLYVLAGSWQRTLEGELVESARRALIARVDTVPAGVQAGRDTLRLLARSPVLANGTIGDIRRTLYEWNRQSSQFEGFYFNTLDGLAYAADGEPVAVRDREYFSMVLRGEEVIARPLRSRFTQRPVLLMLVPVWDAGGHLVGSLGGAMLLDNFLARTVARSQVASASLLLLDRDGVLLAGSVDGEPALLEVPDAARAPKANAVTRAITAALAEEEVQPSLRIVVGGEVLRVLHAPVPTVSWRLAYVLPESQLLAPLVEARRLAWVVVVAASAAALILAILLYRLIVHPVRQLTDAQRRLQAGDRQVRADVAGNDEFADLATSFNRMAETLQHSEGRFRSVFEAAPYAVTLNRMADGTFLDVNPAFERFSGFRRDEVIGRSALDIGRIVDVEATQAQAKTLQASGRLDNIEMRGIDRNGVEQWTLYSSRLIELDGEPVAISMTTDITALKRSEQELRDSEAAFTALFELAPIPLAYTDQGESGRGTRWNQAWYRSFGYSREEADGRKGIDFGLWADLQERLDYLAAVAREGEVRGREVRMRRRDGALRQVEIFGRFINVGGRRVLMSAYVDVSDARRAAEELQARETWLRSLFEVSPVAVLVLDLDGSIRECNRRFVEMLGHDSAEILGHSYFDFVHPSHLESARQGVGRMLVDPSLDVFATERAYVRKDGSMLLGLLSARRLPSNRGDEDVLLVIISDITELKRAEAQRLESETKLQTVFNETPTAMIVSDVRRNYAAVAANDAWERQFLRRREEVMGLSGAEMGLWESTSDRDQVLATIAREGSVDGFETQLVRGDGVRLLCRISARKMIAGDAELLVMVQEDITELRRAEASLQEVNAELSRQLALSDAVARAQSDFIADATATGAFESMLADLLRVADSEYGFVGEVLADREGNSYLKAYAITNIAWDEDSRRHYEAAMAAGGLEFHNLKTLFGAAILTGEPVIANDPRHDARSGGLPPGHAEMRSFLGLPIRVGGRLVALAGVANRPGGYDQALVNWLQPLLLTIGQMVEARRATLARLAAEAALRELNEALDARVRERTAELRRTNDELVTTLETLQRAQGDLIRSEKLAALGSLVAGVAHELNTPIGNSVTVASTLVEHSEAFAGEIAGNLKRSVLIGYVDNSKRAAELLLANLQRAANLVSSFKQVAVDQTSEQRRRFELAEVVGEILAMLHPQLRKRPVEIRCDIEAGLFLDGYPGPFGQVIANLINNAAIHAFNDGRSLGTIRIEAKSVAGGVRFVISDDGVGIPPDHLDRIFDPFFTTRLGQGGAGLGLNIVYNIVTGVLGGTVRVDSRLGEGASFIVQLPLVAPARDLR